MVSQYGYYKEILQDIKDSKQLPIYRVNEIGSRMSSKTWSSIDFIIWASILQPCKTDAFRYFKGKDRTELYEQFKKQIEHMGLIDVVEEHKTNMTLTFPNGSIIEVQGLHSPTQKGEVKLTGKSASTKFKYHFALAEERYEIDDKLWSAVLQAIRGSKNFMEIHLANPWILTNDYVSYVNEHLPFDLNTLIENGQQFKIADKEIKLLDGETFKYKEIFHITNYQINEHLTLIDKVKLELGAKQDPHRANTILYGYYGTPEGAIWKWVLPKMMQKPTEPSITYLGGVDYGERGDATTAYVAGFNSGDRAVHIQHEYYQKEPNKNGKNTNDLAIDVVNHFIDFIEDKDLQGEFDVWVDGSAIPFITALNTYCEDIGWDTQLHFYQQTDKKRVSERIETMKTLASYGLITIDSQCKELLRELNEQVYNDNVSKTSIDYVNGDDHGTDAMYYAIAPKWVSLLENMDYVLTKLAEQEIAEKAERGDNA